MVHFGQGGGQGGDVGFEDGDSGLDFGFGCLGGWEFGLPEEVFDGGADHFGDAVVASGGAEVTEALVFVVGQAEADGSASGFGVHGV